VSFANTRIPPERENGGVSGTLRYGRIMLRGLRFANSRAANQLRFSRRFMRLLTRSGFCVGNTACNNLAGVLDDFPIPATLFAVWHNAEFNVFHQLVPRNDYQGGTRTLCTVPHSEHMNARSPGSRPRGEMSAT